MTSLSETHAHSKSRWFALPREDRLLLMPLGAALLAWLALACIFTWIIPNTSGGNLEKGTAFASYAIRNATYFLFGFLILTAFRFLRDSAGQDSLSYIKATWHADPKRFLAAPLMLVLGIGTFALFMFAYTTIKIRIPEMVPFLWDEAFARWDAALFGGVDPWRYFAGLYDFPAAVRFIDFIYDFWAVLLVGSWVSCFISRTHSLQRRLQYCLALILTWAIGGNLIATLLSSAGPCYYVHLFPGTDLFGAQMAALQQIEGLRAIEYQNLLWATYSSPGLGAGGISAMPSMHCATAFLFILMFGTGKVSRALTSAFFAVIFLGSFVLAWHYAIDGILAALIAYGCWKAAGFLSTKLAPAAD